MATSVSFDSRLDDRISGWTGLKAHPLDRAAIILVYLAFPMALLGEFRGVTVGALGWGLALLVGAIAFLVVPLAVDLVRSASLFVAFMAFGVTSLLWSIDFAEGLQVLAQFATVGVAYVAGWRAMGADRAVRAKLSKLSLWLLPAALIVFLNAASDGASTFGWIRGGNAARPMVMMLALLFLLGTVGRSRSFTLMAWGGAFLIAVASGGRMGVAVLGVMLILTPALRASWKTRLALVGLGFAVLALLIQFDSVQERLFVGREEGQIQDILALEGNFNTAGRSQNWPRIYSACSDEPILGLGAGAAGLITLEATAGRTPHPHNDYLRTFCEYGLVGSGLFWGFFLLLGWRGWRLFRHRAATQIESEMGSVGALAVVALLMFATTDNVIVYTATFMAAAGVIWGIMDRTLSEVEGRVVGIKNRSDIPVERR